MGHAGLKLVVITQERQLLDVTASQVTIQTEVGELTILPGHVGLFTRLVEGLMTYVGEKGGRDTVAIFGGFMDVSPEGTVTILADAADRAEDLDLRHIETARSKAEAVLKDKQASPEAYTLAQTALSQTYLKLKAVRSRKANVSKSV